MLTPEQMAALRKAKGDEFDHLFLTGMIQHHNGALTMVKNRFGYDDTLDAFGVHGAGGTLGAILTGVFATNAVNDGLKDSAGKVLPASEQFLPP